MSQSKKPLAHQIMTDRIPIVAPEEKIGSVTSQLQQNVARFESISFIYVVDARHHLVNVLSIKDLYRHPAEKPVADITMRRPLLSVGPDTSQEAVAHLAVRNKLNHIPVIGLDGRFLGAILPDTLLNTLERENREDIFRLAGVHPQQAAYDDIFKISIAKSIWHRLPWLLIGLVGGLLVAELIEGFNITLQENLVLAAFIPLIVYMSDAVGTQMEAFAVRDFAMHLKINYVRYFWRQYSIVLLIALLASAAFFVVGLVLYQDFLITLVLALALFIAINSSVLTGLLIPFIFRKLKFDPANASGPIATILQNVISITIYFTIATWLLK